VAAVILIVLIVVYYEEYAKGKTAGLTAGTSSVLANIPNPANDDDYTTSERQAIRTYASWLDGEFHWYSVHNDRQWAALALETDRILTGVSNQYALDYATPGLSTSGTGNLYNDIQSTYFFTTSDPATVATRLQKILNI
jgi:hypothetical protein